MGHTTRGLFDEQFRLEKISRQNDPLEKLQAHIDFEFFRKPLEGYFKKDIVKGENKGGRPPYDYVLMFKIVILQRYYNLSDDATEYAILDRLSLELFPNDNSGIIFRQEKWGVVYNVYGHLGYEVYPKEFSRAWLGRWINTSVNHNQHHQFFNGNYGLYFLWWDRWMGTLRTDYDRQFDDVKNRVAA